MIVWDREKLAFPVQYPSFPIGGLALWTVPVPATVVTYLIEATTGASGFVSAQNSSPTGPDRLQGFKDLNRRLVFIYICFVMDTYND